MKKQLSTIIAIACFSLATIPAAIAMHDHKGGRGNMHILKELDLSSQQKQDIKTLMQQTRANNAVYAADREAFKTQMQTLMNMPTWDATLATQLIQQQISQKQQVELNRAKAKHAVYQLLTDEQQSELNAKMAEKADRKDNKGKQDKKRDGKKHAGKRMERRLDLSDEQKEAMKSIREQTKQDLSAIKAESKGFKEAERTLIQAETFDESAWLELHAQYADNFAAQDLIKLKAKYQEFALLTDEQKEKMEKMREKMQRKMKDKRPDSGSM